MSQRKILLGVLGATLTLGASAVYAAAFQSFEMGASGLGDAYSGMAATADDATTEFYNPAGLTRLFKPTVSVSVVGVDAHAHFTGTGAANMGNNDILETARHNETDPLGFNALPAIHLAMPLTDRLAFGFGVTVPFGLKTNYNRDSAARYYATNSSIETFNFSPSLAYLMTPMISVAAGLDVQYLTAELDQQIDFGYISGKGTNLKYDGTLENSADAWALGAHAGILFQFSPMTRLGFSYRSPIHYGMDGSTKVYIPSTFTETEKENLQDAGFNNTDFSTNMTLPETAIASFFHGFNQQWSILSSVSYTHWARFQDLTIRFHNQLPETSIKENFRDTWRYALGLHYELNKHWLFRVGTAYDRSPTNNQWRTLRLPDADRIWGSLGLRYTWNPSWSVDAGYTYIHIKGGTAQEEGPNYMMISGEYDRNYANLFGLQLNYSLN